MISLKESKRVFFINVTFGSGSTGRIVSGLYDLLTEKGFTCMGAYGRGTAPEGYHAYRIGSDFGVNVHGALSRITDKHGQYSKAATRKLIAVMEEFHPSIVHLHNIHGYYLNVELLFHYLKESGVKVIWTLHDCWSFTGHCTHFEYVGCNKWKTGCYQCEQLREYPKSILRDGSKNNYHWKKELFTQIPDMQLVTPSEWLKSKVLNSYMKDYEITVIPTGIDLTTLHPVEDHYRMKYGLQKRFIILGVANPWRERKGIEEFKKLSNILDERYKIVLIGLNEKQKQELPDNILGLNKTNSLEEMAAWYSTADVYLNLTLEDTFPTTNIEALACGTPVITYRAGGSPESIDDSCGMVVERCNMIGITAALDVLRQNESKSKACILKAKQYSKEKRFLEYFEKVYAKL
ncbi:MAG: glycosyltransferase [Lachnospiraceae bacterium]|nr:glycosyltransferase [Lachnospiraceae bacterium]